MVTGEGGRELSPAEALLRLMSNGKVRDFIDLVDSVGWDIVQEVRAFQTKLETRLKTKATGE